MSDPVNGVPPAPPAPPGAPPPNLNPRELPKQFSDWHTLLACVVMDRIHADLRVVVAQLQFIGQHQLAAVYDSARQQLEAVREQFYRQAQGGIILAGPGDMPRG